MADRTPKQKSDAAAKRAEPSPCGRYSVACSEPALRNLIVRLLRNDELYERLKQHPRDVLAEACIEEGRQEFMLMILPLRVAGGTGSPVNPVAMF